MKTIVFTSTLSSEMAQWLDKFSKKNKMTKRSVLEKALENYRTQLTKQEFEEGFKKASQDASLNKMTGVSAMADYLQHLSRHP